MYKALWETTGWVDLYSPSCHFWAEDQPHSNILQMMLIKTECCRSKLKGFNCRILSRLSAKAYPGQSLMLWELSPGSLLVIMLLLFKVLCFSGHSQSLSTVSLSCFSSPSTLLISFLTVLDKAVHFPFSCLYCCRTPILSLWSSESPFKAQFISYTFKKPSPLIPLHRIASFS